ncbi:4Fe-4S binding protein [Deferribacterales bacterium Es71-Z0220]|uniref:4Fe-4S binding protein n=1 Tax=Deferrivibrio essentukiensis TaxID=2880922 RepID=UPI001F607466|nr:4Fe-4S binding protein [Deferrivibrio essentukiensis]MCB4203918.1 4Fe-4S binding protein [Deferrivibrio essentukiensis]
MKIKSIRRSIQIFVFLLMFIVPVLNIFEIYFIKGTFYSIDVGSIAMADPLAVFQAIVASKSFTLTMLASIIIPIMLLLIFGRIWCSYMCPYYFITEMIEGLRKKLRLKSNKPKYAKEHLYKTNVLRLSFLLFGLFVMGIAGIPLLNLISAPGIISSQALVMVKFGYVTFEIVFILFLIVMEFFYYKFWCRYFCPTGSFLSVLGLKRMLNVKKINEDCSMCLSCIKVCPMAINPMEDGQSIACNNCGDCIDNCPDNHKRPTLKYFIK